jgi:uncharacterized protein YhbP (UPF0306 family)
MIQRSRRPIAEKRMTEAAHRLLEASKLCAIATVTPRNDAHVNTAYFAWTPEWRLLWLSDPGATHSRNIRTNGSAAVAVYDSNQSWGKADSGIQLHGSVRQLAGSEASDAEQIYARRFPVEPSAYRFFEFRARRLKLFDEAALGPGTFVTAAVGRGGRLRWQRTEIYKP